MRLMDLLTPNKAKLTKQEAEELKRVEEELTVKIRVVASQRDNHLNELCWSWFREHHTKDQFKSGDKVVINTLLTPSIPLRRDLFLNPEEGYVTTRALPCFDAIIEACAIDPRDIVVRRTKGWIDEEYFKKLIASDFELHCDKFYLRYGVKLKNPDIKSHFNNGEASLPEIFLVKRNTDVGEALHGIGLMERHIMKQQDSLVDMYKTLDKISKPSPPIQKVSS